MLTMALYSEELCKKNENKMLPENLLGSRWESEGELGTEV